MQQDHVESRAEEKSGSGPARAKTVSELTSQARTVLNLQHAAGNRAMARFLAPPARAVPVQRAALSPVAVQRDELTDAIREVISEDDGGEEVVFPALAQTLVHSWRANGLTG